MVRALLAGTKTQTRRIVKPQPLVGDGGCWFPEPPRNPTHRARHYANEAHMVRGLPIDFCPYGAPGDRLWVRESIKRVPASSPMYDVAVYVADGAETPLDSWGWRRGVLPAIHCPRGLSRITLEVTGVRVERLQDISEADAMAEGVEAWGSIGSDQRIPGPGFDGAKLSEQPHCLPYVALWENINGDGSWAVNPWVWVVEFRRVTP
jgi:hypothetical protein